MRDLPNMYISSTQIKWHQDVLVECLISHKQADIWRASIRLFYDFINSSQENEYANNENLDA